MPDYHHPHGHHHPDHSMGFIRESLGSALVAGSIAAVMSGMVSVQTILFYHNQRRRDSVLPRLIFILWMLDVVNLALMIATLYHYLVENFRHSSALDDLTPVLMLLIMTTSIINALARGIFERQIIRLCRGIRATNRRLAMYTAPLAITATVALLCGIGVSIGGLVDANFESLRSHLGWMVYLGLSAEVLADIALMVSLLSLFRKLQTGLPRPVDTLQLLGMYAINTGILNGGFAMVVVVTFALAPSSLLPIAVYFLLSKVLLNSLLANLNLRTGFSRRDSRSYQLHRLSRGSTWPSDIEYNEPPILDIRRRESDPEASFPTLNLSPVVREAPRNSLPVLPMPTFRLRDSWGREVLRRIHSEPG